MPTLYALYVQNPFWVWLAVAAVFVGSGCRHQAAGKLIWAGGGGRGAGLRQSRPYSPGLAPVESCIFAVAGDNPGRGGPCPSRRWKAKPASIKTAKDLAETPLKTVRSIKVARSGRRRACPTRRMKTAPHGASGRAASPAPPREFANGVGRVFIDGAEWAAELDGDGNSSSIDTPGAHRRRHRRRAPAGARSDEELSN